MAKINEQILIIDNDEGMSLLLKRELKKISFSVEICTSGKAALDWLEENDPALMLLDLDLPDISGQELLKTLTDRDQNIPFIVVSGKSDLRVAVEMMQEGAHDFLFKDANMLSMVAPIVARVLEVLKMQRQLEEAEARQVLISRAMSDVFWMSDPKMQKMLYVSPSYEKIWGQSVSLLYEDTSRWTDAVVEEDRSKVLRAFEGFREGYEDEFEEVYRIKDKLGQIRWIEGRGYTTVNARGEVIYFSGVATDISERKELERQVVEASERERIRLGQDLHDDLCQRLAALKLSYDRVADTLESQDNPEQAEILRKITEDLGAATTLSRSIAKGLSPVSLEAEGLMFALEEMAGIIESRFDVSCRFDCPVPIEVGSPTIATHLFRISQELVNNAAKHAHPTRIVIGLYQAVGGFTLEVVNDGLPFHLRGKRNRGMGLHSIEFRADAIGASLDFIPGKMPFGGTRVICTVPIVMKRTEGI